MNDEKIVYVAEMEQWFVRLSGATLPELKIFSVRRVIIGVSNVQGLVLAELYAGQTLDELTWH